MSERSRYILSNPPRILRKAASLRLTTVCLILLMILTAAGTLYQVHHGIYAAKARFFTSWFAVVFGVLPLPGGKTVMALFFVNLTAALLTRFPLRLDRTGLWLVHLGLLVLCVGAFCIYALSRESTLVLHEGELARVSISDRDWELSFWKSASPGGRRHVTGFPVSNRSVGAVFDLPNGGHVRVEQFLEHCKPVPAPEAPGGRRLEPLPPPHDPAYVRPGVRLTVETGNTRSTVVLHAGDPAPAALPIGDALCNLALRRRRFPLPFPVRLVDVRRTLYPGTQIARSYESTVEIGEGEAARRAVISMNHPLSLQGYTFYQAGYAADRTGRETSTLQVVQNPARFLPYAGSILGAVGLTIHFLLLPLVRGSRQKRRAV